MKKILLAASVAALLAVGCKGTDKTANSEETTTVGANGIAASADMVYFDLDSLVSKYDMYIDMRSTYEGKAQKAEAELSSKGRALERDAASYQDKASKGLITRSEGEKLVAKLQADEQTFMQYREKVMTDLAEEEQVMLNNIHNSIIEYLKEYNADMRYGMILSSSTAGGPVMNADPKLNITKEVLEGLNKKYAANKPAPAPAK